MSMSPVTMDLQNLELVSTLRVAPQNGPPNSNDYNDGEQEKLTDLTTLATFLNNTLLPMLNTLLASAASGIDGTGIVGAIGSEEALFFNPATSSSLSVADALRFVYGQLQTSQTAQSNLAVQVAQLQSRLSSTNQNDISLALQGFTGNLNGLLGQLTALQSAVSTLQLIAGTSLDAQTATPVIAPGSIETVSCVWSVPFSNNNYTVAYGIEDSSGYLQVTGFTYLPSGTGVLIRVLNTDTAASHSGTVHAEGRYNQLTSV